MSNAERIQQWRDANPGGRLTKATLQTILGTDLHGTDLHGANLRFADLHDTDLHGANLRFADLYFADLHGANLRFADLYFADLHFANLYDADMRGADLRGADMRGADLHFADLRGAYLGGADMRGADLRSNSAGILTIDGAHPYRAELVPTPNGWVLTIGCWQGTISELRALIAQDEGWPEATGKEIEERRPVLEAVADLCDAHVARHAGLIDDLAKRWDS